MDPLHGHELCNRLGDRVGLLNYGARITQLALQLDEGPRNVVLGYDRPQDYLQDRWYMGCITGRFTNRVRNARFELDGHDFSLAANEGRHQLHGGPDGFDRCYWSLAPGADQAQAEFRLLSPDGDQGWPGNLRVTACYRWNDQRELSIELSAETDRPTHVNLSSHAYFNLDSHRTDVRDHRLRINGNHITELDAGQLPTGTLCQVAGTGFDFRRLREIGAALGTADETLQRCGGADINYVLNEPADAAELWSRDADLQLGIGTSCPGLQFYSGQHLRTPWAPFAGLCLEPQFFPDSPNQPRFPSTLLRPGERYQSAMVYRFRTSPEE